jgi:hypothetical protein
MAQIGLNHRLSVARTLKKETRALYEGVFGATVKSPRPDTEIFTFANGSGIGVRRRTGCLLPRAGGLEIPRRAGKSVRVADGHGEESGARCFSAPANRADF